MPLLGSFGAACARGLGLGNGEAPLAPSITAPADVVRTVSAVSGNGTTVTYTTSTTHGFAVGQLATVAGVTTTTAYNGSFIIASIPSETTFTVTASTTGTGTISGDETATCNAVLGTAITAAISYTITISTFPLARVEYKLDKINASNTVTDAGQWTGTLSGTSGTNSATLSTRVNSSGGGENLLHAQKYALYLRAVDGAGQTGPESEVRRFTTGAEVAPIAATPVISSSLVSYPTTPFLSFTWGAGTAGTYSIGTRQYSVVAGNNLGAGTYTTMSGTSGTETIRYTSNGTAIRAGTEYTVYLKYTSTSPTLPAGFGTAYAVGTTASEVAPSAPNSANLTRNTANLATERSQIILTPGTITNAPTYNYKFQYALSTSNPPTNWADWPFGNTPTAWTVSASAATTYYLRFRSMSILPDGTEVTASAATDVASVTTRANVPPAPTFGWSGMSGSSHTNPTFSLTSNGASTSSMRILEPGLGLLPGASGLSSGVHTITMNYESNGATKAYYAQAVNVDGDASSNSSTIYWTLPTKNVDWSVADETSAIYFSNTESVTSEFRYVFGGGIPDNNNAPGYYDVRSLSVEGISQTGTNLNGCSGVTKTLANTATLFWQTTSAHPDFYLGKSNVGWTTHWPTGSFSTRSVTLTTYGGSALNNTVWNVHTTIGFRTGSGAVGCSIYAGNTLNGFRMKNFVISGKRTTNGSGTGF